MKGNGSAATFANGRDGTFTIGSHLVVTVDGGRHWNPQPNWGTERLYRLKWLGRGRLLAAGVKATLLVKVHSDGSVSLLGRGVPLPIGSRMRPASVVRLGWPDTWWAINPPGSKKKGTVLSEVDLATGRMLAHYRVASGGTFILFHGGFVLVAPRGQFKSWLEVYRIEHGRPVMTQKTKADFWQMLEWRPHGELVYTDMEHEHLQEFDIHTGTITPTTIRLKQWIVPPNPNSATVIMHSKAWMKAGAALIRMGAKLKGKYGRRSLQEMEKLGRPGVNIAPWKWMKTVTEQTKKLLAEQQKAAGK